MPREIRIDKKRFQKIAVSLLAYIWLGGFATFSFAPFSQSYLVWFVPFPLFYISQKYRNQWKLLLYHGFGFAIFFYLFSFHWIYHMITVFGGFPDFLAVIMFVFSGIFLNLKFPAFLLVFDWLRRRISLSRSWMAGTVALATDLALPQVFPWYWGSVVAENKYLAQTAEFASAYGLSFLLFFLSYPFYLILRLGYLSWRKQNFSHFRRFFIQKKRTWDLGLFFFIKVLFFGGGILLYWHWTNAEPVGSRTVAMIQPNAPLEFRDGRSIKETMDELMDRIDRLAELTYPKQLDLMVLPESSVPFFSANPTLVNQSIGIYWYRFDRFMKLLALRHKTNIFMNELDTRIIQINGKDQKRFYNSTSLYDPNGDRHIGYDKNYLLIGGEYMPFDWMYELSPQTSHFAPGERMELIPYYSSDSDIFPGAKALRWKDTEIFPGDQIQNLIQNKLEPKVLGKFLPLICYEVIIPEYVRQFQGDPDFLVNVTNDKWYGKSIESYQHYTLGRLRSIEFRKWMVRSTNSGTSVFINHLGEPLESGFSLIEDATTQIAEIKIIPGYMTFYRKFGNLIPWTLVVITGICYAWRRAFV